VETLVLAFAIAIAIIALVLYFELKTTQQRMEALRGEIDHRVTLTLQSVMHETADKIPQIEKRVEEISLKIDKTEAEVHELQSHSDGKPSTPTPTPTPAAEKKPVAKPN
jgi:uncharacterized protein YoxC